ncbi:hypothetical protein SYNPS1DRAFT_30021, partial [Syncephalis pseudoplumigaleata]
MVRIRIAVLACAVIALLAVAHDGSEAAPMSMIERLGQHAQKTVVGALARSRNVASNRAGQSMFSTLGSSMSALASGRALSSIRDTGTRRLIEGSQRLRSAASGVVAASKRVPNNIGSFAKLPSLGMGSIPRTLTDKSVSAASLIKSKFNLGPLASSRGAKPKQITYPMPPPGTSGSTASSSILARAKGKGKQAMTAITSGVSALGLGNKEEAGSANTRGVSINTLNQQATGMQPGAPLLTPPPSASGNGESNPFFQGASQASGLSANTNLGTSTAASTSPTSPKSQTSRFSSKRRLPSSSTFRSQSQGWESDASIGPASLSGTSEWDTDAGMETPNFLRSKKKMYRKKKPKKEQLPPSPPPEQNNAGHVPLSLDENGNLLVTKPGKVNQQTDIHQSNLEVARALESHGHLNMATAAMSTAGGFLTAVTNSAMTARDNNNERASAERQTQNVIQGQLALEKMAHSNQKEREAQRAAEMALLREVELADVKKDEKLSLYELKLREMVMREQLKKQRMGGNQQGATTGMADEEAMLGDMGQEDDMGADDEMDDVPPARQQRRPVAGGQRKN